MMSEEDLYISMVEYNKLKDEKDAEITRLNILLDSQTTPTILQLRKENIKLLGENSRLNEALSKKYHRESRENLEIKEMKAKTEILEWKAQLGAILHGKLMEYVDLFEIDLT